MVKGTKTAAAARGRQSRSKGGRCCTNVADGDVDRMTGVAVGCPVSKKERVRDTAVSRGKARVEVPFERHMYSKITPTVVSKMLKKMATMVPNASANR